MIAKGSSCLAAHITTSRLCAVMLLLLQRTVTAMIKVGIPPEQREAVFATVAAVLHLGNVSFVEGKESDSSAVAPGSAQEHLQAAGKQSSGIADKDRGDFGTVLCHVMGLTVTKSKVYGDKVKATAVQLQRSTGPASRVFLKPCCEDTAKLFWSTACL